MESVPGAEQEAKLIESQYNKFTNDSLEHGIKVDELFTLFITILHRNKTSGKILNETGVIFFCDKMVINIKEFSQYFHLPYESTRKFFLSNVFDSAELTYHQLDCLKKARIIPMDVKMFGMYRVFNYPPHELIDILLSHLYSLKYPFFSLYVDSNTDSYKKSIRTIEYKETVAVPPSDGMRGFDEKTFSLKDILEKSAPTMPNIEEKCWILTQDL